MTKLYQIYLIRKISTRNIKMILKKQQTYILLLSYCIIVTILFSCKRQIKNVEGINKVDRIVQEEYEVMFSYDNCIKEEMEHDSLYIFFESIFNNDFVEVFVNNEKEMSSSITTDLSLGLAKEMDLGKLSDIKEVSFKINNGKDVVIRDFNCNFLFVGYFKDSLVEVEFRNKFLGYN